MVFRFVIPSQIRFNRLSNRDFTQPDGYLTEERKAADPDQGFSTFFSETGEHIITPML